MQGLFREKNGIFFEELRKKNIVCDGGLIVERNKFSTMYSIYVFIEKSDLQKYYDFLKKALSAYKAKLKLNNFERVKASFMKRAEVGVVSFSGIDEAVQEKNLPFDKVSYDVVKQVAKKVLSDIRTVVIGNDVDANLHR